MDAAHQTPAWVEVFDNDGRLMMLARGQAVSTGVMTANVIALGPAMVTGRASDVLVYAENGDFTYYGPCTTRMFGVGDTTRMDVNIYPPKRLEQNIRRRPRRMTTVLRQIVGRIWFRALTLSKDTPS